MDDITAFLRSTTMVVPRTQVVTLLAVIFVFVVWVSRKSRAPLPPGPKGLPVVGNLLGILAVRFGLVQGSDKPLWAQFIEMGKAYNSDIIHMPVLGDHTVILNSSKAVTELMEKKWAIFSDRPPMHMVNDLMGWHWDFSHKGYSDSFRLHRKTFDRYFLPREIIKHQPLQRKLVSILLSNLVTAPDDFFTHVRRHAASLILGVTYGITSEEEKDYYVDLAHRAFSPVIAAGNHGTYFVDYFPLLKHVPSWFPGAQFKRKAKIWASHAAELREQPWRKIQNSISNGNAMPCFVTENLEKFSSDLDEMEEVIKCCAAIAYIAGSDTTVALILSSILALLANPEVQTRAQAELDSVIGDSRLPDFNDREKLPYLGAIMSEALRLYPVAPLALPHYSNEDCIYEGYYIPKGSTIVGNAWAVLHEPELYPDPLKFIPDRFMKQNGKELPPDPANYAFGFGRRTCPGRWFAVESAWLAIACLLATCNIKKAPDSNMKDIDPLTDFGNGLAAHPNPYKCRFVPRSGKALNLMKSGFESFGQ